MATQQNPLVGGLIFGGIFAAGALLRKIMPDHIQIERRTDITETIPKYFDSRIKKFITLHQYGFDVTINRQVTVSFLITNNSNMGKITVLEGIKVTNSETGEISRHPGRVSRDISGAPHDPRSEETIYNHQKEIDQACRALFAHYGVKTAAELHQKLMASEQTHTLTPGF